jgi:Flp pilus assembly protein TadG
MMSMPKSRREPGARGRGDDGVALVEFAFVSVLLLTLVFGIISFGLILSFKQDLTRAAAEGARAGAVALPSSVYGSNDPRRLAAVTATNEAVRGFDRTCGAGGLTCAVSIHDCDDPVPDSNGYHAADPTAKVAGAANSQPDCVTVDLRFDHLNNPLVAPVPLISTFLPHVIDATSVVRLNQ